MITKTKYNDTNSHLYCPYDTTKCDKTGECVKNANERQNSLWTKYVALKIKQDVRMVVVWMI